MALLYFHILRGLDQGDVYYCGSDVLLQNFHPPARTQRGLARVLSRHPPDGTGTLTSPSQLDRRTATSTSVSILVAIGPELARQGRPHVSKFLCD